MMQMVLLDRESDLQVRERVVIVSCNFLIFSETTVRSDARLISFLIRFVSRKASVGAQSQAAHKQFHADRWWSKGASWWDIWATECNRSNCCRNLCIGSACWSKEARVFRLQSLQHAWYTRNTFQKGQETPVPQNQTARRIQ